MIVRARCVVDTFDPVSGVLYHAGEYYEISSEAEIASAQFVPNETGKRQLAIVGGPTLEVSDATN
jgi:hypothetical protein